MNLCLSHTWHVDQLRDISRHNPQPFSILKGLVKRPVDVMHRRARKTYSQSIRIERLHLLRSNLCHSHAAYEGDDVKASEFLMSSPRAVIDGWFDLEKPRG